MEEGALHHASLAGGSSDGGGADPGLEGDLEQWSTASLRPRVSVDAVPDEGGGRVRLRGPQGAATLTAR
jgi:hypothetical protein